MNRIIISNADVAAALLQDELNILLNTNIRKLKHVVFMRGIIFQLKLVNFMRNHKMIDC